MARGTCHLRIALRSASHRIASQTTTTLTVKSKHAHTAHNDRPFCRCVKFLTVCQSRFLTSIDPRFALACPKSRRLGKNWRYPCIPYTSALVFLNFSAMSPCVCLLAWCEVGAVPRLWLEEYDKRPFEFRTCTELHP